MRAPGKAEKETRAQVRENQGPATGMLIGMLSGGKSRADMAHICKSILLPNEKRIVHSTC
jgi:hypothetical protein